MIERFRQRAKAWAETSLASSTLKARVVKVLMLIFQPTIIGGVALILARGRSESEEKRKLRQIYRIAIVSSVVGKIFIVGKIIPTIVVLKLLFSWLQP